MKLTKEEALTDCFDLWLSLAVSGDAHKNLSHVWKINGGWMGNYEARCPCCEFGRCCIIAWPGGDCVREKGPFILWSRSKTPADRTKYALKICVLALDALRGIG